MGWLKKWTLGKVDEFEDEFVETEYLGKLPLIPLQSYYCRGSREESFEIPLWTKSVIFGYVRFYACWLALAIGLAALGEIVNDRSQGGIVLLGAAGGLLGLWWAACYRLGGATDKDRHRRAHLLQVTNISAYPAMLPEPMCKKMLKRLERAWKENWREWKGRRSWRDSITKGARAEAVPYLAALAAYAARLDDKDLGAKDLEAEAWIKLEEVAPAPIKTRSSEPAQDPIAEEQPAKKAEPATKCKKKSIKMLCPRCDEVTRVPSTFAGKKGLCPKCHGAIRVPSMRSKRAA